MPVILNLPPYTNPASVEDIAKYNKLPYYFVKDEIKYFAEWQTWNQLFGKIDWVPNQGTTMRSVRFDPTPISEQQVFPKSIQEQPNRNVFELHEVTNDAVLTSHQHDSKLIIYLPSFQDFRDQQLDPLHKDIIRQIAGYNDAFIATQCLQRCPQIFIPKNQAAGENNLIEAPIPAAGSTVLTSATVPKNQAFWLAQIAKIGTEGLPLAMLDYMQAVLMNDLGAPPFEGTVNTPKDNELVKGKYVWLTDQETFNNIKYDPQFGNWRNINIDVVNQGWAGSIFGKLTAKILRFPLRVAADGTFPAPQIIKQFSAANTNPISSQLAMNPDYVNAPYQIDWFIGDGFCRTIKVGPPPSQFAGKMNRKQFSGMSWNGEVGLTNNVLIPINDGNGNITWTPNSRGKYCKFESETVMGLIMANAYNAFPVLFKRQRANAFVH